MYYMVSYLDLATPPFSGHVLDKDSNRRGPKWN